MGIGGKIPNQLFGIKLEARNVSVKLHKPARLFIESERIEALPNGYYAVPVISLPEQQGIRKNTLLEMIRVSDCAEEKARFQQEYDSINGGPNNFGLIIVPYVNAYKIGNTLQWFNFVFPSNLESGLSAPSAKRLYIN